MLRRWAITDPLLVALSCAVIILSVYPSGQPRQTFQARGADGRVQAFSLPSGDPTLTDLRRRFGESAQQLPPAKLAIARWTRELADFYGRSIEASENRHSAMLDQDPESVVTVSFDDSSRANRGSISDPATRAYWLGVKDRSERAIETIEQEIAKRRNSPPPVQFGETLEPQATGLAYVFAIAAGLLVALAYAVWRHHSQPLVLETAGQRGELVRMALSPRFSGVCEPESLSLGVLVSTQVLHMKSGSPRPASGRGAGGEGHSATGLQALGPGAGGRVWQGHVEFPAEWIRVRQPIGVIVRRLSLLSIVTWALACVII